MNSMPTFRIIGAALLAFVIYGNLHDQVTAREFSSTVTSAPLPFAVEEYSEPQDRIVLPGE